VLAITPDVERALEWFGWTHEVTEHGWRRITLPRDGGLDKQDGRLMTLLEVIRVEANHIAGERRENESERRKTAQWRATRAEHLR
jgi:hypothetical protein